MQCEFLVDKKYCVNPQAAFFTPAEFSDEAIVHLGEGVSSKTATVRFVCVGQENCDIYNFLILKKKDSNK